MVRSDSFGLVFSDIWTLLLFETVCRGSQDRSENPYRATRKYVGREGLKKKKEKERRKFRRKTEKAFSNFIQEYKKSDNFLSEQNFKDNYQDTLKKAHKIYKENDYMGMHDYLAVYDNLLFIADYNGLDGDNWSLNNFGSYRVWVAKLSKEKLDKLNQIIEDLNKVKD